MTQLLLMRHAKSAYPLGVVDHERPLNDRGRRNAQVAAQWLSAQPIETVLVSSARRAQETWQIIAQYVDHPASMVPELYEASDTTIADIVASQADGLTLVVAHNPGLEDYVVRYGRPGASLDPWQQLRHKFPTSAIAHLREGVLVDFVVPR